MYESGKLTFQVVPLSELNLKDADLQRETPRVLVVDDEWIIADTLTAILRQSGLDARSAYNGPEALTAAEDASPDLLLTDVVMPGMSGIDLAIAIQRSYPRCKVLLFSGQASTKDLLDEALLAGHNFAVLQKPIHPKELLARISAVLESPVAV